MRTNIVALALVLSASVASAQVALLYSNGSPGCLAAPISEGWLTPEHCADNPNLTIYNEPVYVLRMDHVNDFAILSSTTDMKPIRFAPQSPVVGDEVSMEGYLSLEYWLRVTDKGEVLAVNTPDPDDLQADRVTVVGEMEVWYGASGAPILNTDGELVGMVHGGSNYQAHGPHLTYISDYNRLTTFLARD